MRGKKPKICTNKHEHLWKFYHVSEASEMWKEFVSLPLSPILLLLSCPFYSWRRWIMEKFSDLFKIMLVLNNWSRTWILIFFFFHYDIFPLLTLNPSQVLIPLKLTSQTTDIILSQSNYQIKNNLMSWFSASIGMLLNWWYSWCSWLQRTLLLILAPTGDLFSSQSMGFLLLLLLLLF